jgi:hypothetical protein
LATRLIISIFAGGAIILHLAFPAVRIDLATMVLAAIGIMPWIAPIIKSLEFPGGIKIELQDVQRATQQLGMESRESGSVNRACLQARIAPPAEAELGEGVSEGPGLEQRLSDLVFLTDQDPNLGLVGLRIEIEHMLRNIARGHNLKWNRCSASGLLRQLERNCVLPKVLVAGLRDLISLGNQAAHGAEVSSAAAAWAMARAPEILDALTDYLGS